MKEFVEEIVELSLLFDFYGELLDEHKKKIFEDYVLNDLSLAEIADEQGISRQGVHDIVKRCTKKMKEYESVLHLVEKFQDMEEKLTEVTGLLEREEQITHTEIMRARQLLKQVIAEL